MKTESLEPNLKHARDFLKTLANGNANEPFTFQTIDDNSAKPKDRSLIVVRHGTLDEHVEELLSKNKKGAGVFVTVNKTDLKGRKKENILSPRAVFADKDDGPFESLNPKPTMLVRSKNGDHAYWMPSTPMSLDEFCEVQKMIIDKLGTDPAVKDPPRLMRVPGFFNNKDRSKPFLVELVENNDIKYSPEQLKNEFYKSKKSKKKAGARTDRSQSANASTLQEFRDWVLGLPINEGHRNATLFKLVAEGLGRGLTREDLQPVVTDYCVRSKLDEAEAAQLLERLVELHLETPFTSNRSPKKQNYIIVDNQIIWQKPTKDGAAPMALCNFSARIISEETIDDGAERKKTFKITGTLKCGKPLGIISVPVDKFPSMNWVTEWGAEAVVYAGNGVKDHLRVAIQILSDGIDTKTVYGHLGWQAVAKEFVFLHASGGIGKDGNNSSIEVLTSGNRLRDYELPDPPSDRKLISAIQASLSVLKMARADVAVPIFLMPYLSPLSDFIQTDFSLYISGPTGTLKTEATAIMQAHFGARFHGKNLPTNWSSSANSIERLGFIAKNCLLTVDDFAPGGSSNDISRMHREADRVFRGMGNRAGRGRMTATSDLRPEYYFRSIVVSSGEDIPRGASLRSRLLNVEISPGDINPNELSALQKFSEAGLLAQSMSAYLQWCAKNYSIFKAELPILFEQKRLEEARTGHLRTPSTIASLLTCADIFLRFAVEQKAVSAKEAGEMKKEFHRALTLIARRQSAHQTGEDPASKFMTLIESALVTGHTHLASSKNGLQPKNPGHWGWRNVSDGRSAPRWEPQGQCIGWVEKDKVMLHPDAAYTIAQQVARNQGDSVPVTKETLWKRLAEKSFIIPSEKEKKNTVKSVVCGQRMRVLILSPASPIIKSRDVIVKPPTPAAPNAPKSDVVSSVDCEVHDASR